MHNIKRQVGEVVAADTQASVKALDSAFLMQSRLCASTIEAACDSNLPIVTTQPLLEALSGAMTDLVRGRAQLAQAVRHVNLIQSKSNLRELNFGCPTGLPGPSGHAKEAELEKMAN